LRKSYSKAALFLASQAVSLLGLGAGEKYILLSNASDPTMLRNDIFSTFY